MFKRCVGGDRQQVIHDGLVSAGLVIDDCILLQPEGQVEGEEVSI